MLLRPLAGFGGEREEDALGHGLRRGIRICEQARARINFESLIQVVGLSGDSALEK
jgi:hypothetical protein